MKDKYNELVRDLKNHKQIGDISEIDLRTAPSTPIIDKKKMTLNDSISKGNPYQQPQSKLKFWQ